ncbi:MAG: VCBS repeat-containing protein, partial [Bacteroidota bacterium]
LDIVEGIEMGGNNLYLNEGDRFVETSGKLPMPENTETRKVVAADVDQDGDQDLFFCNVGWNPIMNPQNQLLLNDGEGSFANATDQLPEDLATTLDAAFLDLNADGYLDLITTNFVNDAKVQVFTGKRTDVGVKFVANPALLPTLHFYGGTSVLPFKEGGKQLLYFANFKSADILVAEKSGEG